MPCIYPGPHSDQMSVEHPLSYGLGRFDGAILLRDHVCRSCNTEVGKRTETQFLRAGPTGFFRWLLGVRGRDGLPPSPFLAGAGGALPIEMPGRLPDGEHDLLFEVNHGTDTVQPCRQIVFEHPIAGARPVRITHKMQGNPDLLAARLSELGLSGAKPIQAYADPGEIPWVTELVVAMGGAPPAWTSVDLPSARIQLVATYTVTYGDLRIPPRDRQDRVPLRPERLPGTLWHGARVLGREAVHLGRLRGRGPVRPPVQGPVCRELQRVGAADGVDAHPGRAPHVHGDHGERPILCRPAFPAAGLRDQPRPEPRPPPCPRWALPRNG